MRDDELLYWGHYGKKLSEDDTTLNGVNLVGDVLQIWRTLGEVIDRLNLSVPTPERTPFSEDEARTHLSKLRQTIDGLKNE